MTLKWQSWKVTETVEQVRKMTKSFNVYGSMLQLLDPLFHIYF